MTTKEEAGTIETPAERDESVDRKPSRFTPLTQRRFANFRANKRGYWSFWIFLVFFAITLLAEVVANDKPLIIKYEGSLYFPIFKKYAETEFGGVFKVEADYKDHVVQKLIEDKGGWMIWPIIPFSYQTIDYYLPGPAPYPPSKEHWFGTDDTAMDVLARLIYGVRLSFLFGLTLTFFSSIIGVSAGGIQGYFGGRVDLFAQRLIEIWAGLPVLFVLIILASIVESNVYWLLGILIAFNWMSLVGVVRAEFLRARNFQYVTAARALGASDVRIMVKHVLPNAMVATFTFLPFILVGSIVMLTSLDFLGFGLPPESPSLGRLLAQGKANLQAPWLLLTSISALAIMLILLIFVGEAVRDAFDPRKTTLWSQN
ncbi:MAG: ABC transporter permease [Desulfobacterales bacterium]